MRIQWCAIVELEALSNVEGVLGSPFCTGRYAPFAHIAQKVGWIGWVVRVDPKQQAVERPDRVNHPESRLNMPVVGRDLAAHNEIKNTPYLWRRCRRRQDSCQREHQPGSGHYERLKDCFLHGLTSSFVVVIK